MTSECPECGEPIADDDPEHEHDDRVECQYGNCSEAAVARYALDAERGSLRMAACGEHEPASREPDEVLVDDHDAVSGDDSADESDDSTELDRGDDSVAVDVVEHV